MQTAPIPQSRSSQPLVSSQKGLSPPNQRASSTVATSPLPSLARAAAPVNLVMTTPEAIAAQGLGTRTYTAPNELVPARMRPITRQAPAGVYVGVGTERCFITAALNPQLDRIVMLDKDPRIVLYNHVNIAILRGAAHRAEYLELRLHGSVDQILEAIRRGPQLGVEAGLAPIDRPMVEGWVQQVRNNLSGNMQAFNTPPQPYCFASANYLYDYALYARVALLSQSDRMHPVLASLTDAEQMRALGDDLALAEEPIALLDVSNTWDSSYIGHGLWGDAIVACHKALRNDTVLMCTATAWVDSGQQWLRFTYFGARCGALAAPEGLKAWSDMLKGFDKRTRSKFPCASRVEHLDGHLLAYER